MTNEININGLNVNYTVTGEGDDLILLHGWGCSLDIFKAIQQHLSSFFKVYSIDFPGFGKSEEPREVWGVQEYTLMVEQFVKKLEIQNPILLGHSFGGRISIIYSSRNEVNKVILVDSAGIKPKRKLKYYLKVYSFKCVKKLLPLFLNKKKAEEIISNYRGKSGSSDYNSASEQMKKILVKTVNEDLKCYMPKITAPVLLIWGEKDTATPVGDAKIMEKLIKNSGLVVFKGAGHYSFLERPYEFKAVLNSFLKIQ